MKRLLVICLAVNSLQYTRSGNVGSCKSKVYCQGKLLDTVQRANLFVDSKTFVDRSLLKSENQTLNNFEELMQSSNNNPSKDQLKKFLEDNFLAESELENWRPEDFTDSPQLLSRISNSEIKKFVGNLVGKWPLLGRKVKVEVRDKPEQHSLIYIPNGFIIPGGRFKEIYYWDSFWIIQGLLLSDMTNTAKLMIENLLYLAGTYGFVPNGSRVYYLDRSQPPLLTLMVDAYIKKTNDLVWLENNIETLEKELGFWFNNRMLSVNGFTVAHYSSSSNTPRPESYIEDIKTCSIYQSQPRMEECFTDLKAGAESGWDFSSRWIVNTEDEMKNLSQIQTRKIIPVELNAILTRACGDLAKFYTMLKKPVKANIWTKQYNKLHNSLNSLLFDKQDMLWFDYDLNLDGLRKIFYPSNFAPLWLETYDKNSSEIIAKAAVKYLENKHLDEFKGGISTSLLHTGEQWDYPNAWPPLQDMIIMGLERTRIKEAKHIAKKLAQRWIESMLTGFKNTNEMFEKYNAENKGQIGGGGEYVVQTGFGWTNGVALSLIDYFFTDNS